MPYNPSNPTEGYAPATARPDIAGQVTWTQSLLIQNYNADKYIVVDKEVKGGLHRVKYKSMLLNSNYAGIFNSKRVKGMLVYVEFEDDDTPCNKYYSLRIFPGNDISHWEEIGSGASVTLNNPITVGNLTERDALTPAANDFVNVTDARTAQEVIDSVPAYPASYIYDGTQWLTVYPYGQDPDRHTKNNDTQLWSPDLNRYITADEIGEHMGDSNWHRHYNDSTSVDVAADPSYTVNEAWSSHKIATELQKKVTIVENGDPTLFLNQAGDYVAVSTSGGGASLQAGDILGGGGADETYFN